MQNPLRYLSPEARRVDAAAEELFQTLVRTRVRDGANTGVDVPKSDEPFQVKVLMRLLELHPEVLVVTNKKNLTLTFDQSLRGLMAADSYEMIRGQQDAVDYKDVRRSPWLLK